MNDPMIGESLNWQLLDHALLPRITYRLLLYIRQDRIGNRLLLLECAAPSLLCRKAYAIHYMQLGAPPHRIRHEADRLLWFYFFFGSYLYIEGHNAIINRSNCDNGIEPFVFDDDGTTCKAA